MSNYTTNTDKSQDVRITALEMSNVKRIKAVALEPAPAGLTVIGGKNGQGKTSVLDGIAWALGGERFRPDAAKREGSVLDPELRVQRGRAASAVQELLHHYIRNEVLSITTWPSGAPYPGGPPFPPRNNDMRKGPPDAPRGEARTEDAGPQERGRRGGGVGRPHQAGPGSREKTGIFAGDERKRVNETLRRHKKTVRL